MIGPSGIGVGGTSSGIAAVQVQDGIPRLGGFRGSPPRGVGGATLQLWGCVGSAGVGARGDRVEGSPRVPGFILSRGGPAAPLPSGGIPSSAAAGDAPGAAAGAVPGGRGRGAPARAGGDAGGEPGGSERGGAGAAPIHAGIPGDRPPRAGAGPEVGEAKDGSQRWVIPKGGCCKNQLPPSGGSSEKRGNPERGYPDGSPNLHAALDDLEVGYGYPQQLTPPKRWALQIMGNPQRCITSKSG